MAIAMGMLLCLLLQGIGWINMADILYRFSWDRVAVFLVCNPFILLGIAWLSMQWPTSDHTHARNEDSENQPAKVRNPMSMPNTSGEAR